MKNKDVNQFLRLIKSYEKLNVVKHNHHLYNVETLDSNQGLYFSLTTALSEIIDVLQSIHSSREFFEQVDAKLAHKNAKRFDKILNSKVFQDLKTSKDSLPRTKVWNQLKNSKYLFYPITDGNNPAYHQKKKMPQIIINGDHKFYINNSNKTLFGYKDNCNVKNDKEIKKLFQKKGIHIQPNFKVEENPNGSNDIDMPNLLKIGNIRFFYSKKKVSAQKIIQANIPYLSNDQDAYDVIGTTDGDICMY